MPSLREDQQPDAVIDLRHGSLHRARTDEVVLVDDELPELPPEPVFIHEPVLLDAPGSTRKRRRVTELEAIATTNAKAAREARAIALEQRGHLEAATTAWRSTEAKLVELRRELARFAAARADLIAKERARAEQTARTDIAAELQQMVTERDEMRAEIDRLHATLADQQSLSADTTQRLREEQRERAAAEKEAKRAIAAYETAERRLENASEALRRSAADQQGRVEVIEAARAEAFAELEALGGGGQVAKLTNRIEDLVSQLADLDAELVAMQSRADAADATVAEIEVALSSARDEADAAKDRTTFARVRLDEVVRERDILLDAVASLEQAAEERERREADDRARAEQSSEPVETGGLEEALVAARFEAETLRGETTALAAQLGDAWTQVEEARRVAASARAAQQAGSNPGADQPAEGEGTLLDAFAELAADSEARVTPPIPDPEDPDARRAALGFLNSLARGVPPSRRNAT